MRYRIFFFLTFIWLAYPLIAQQLEISGSEPDFKKEDLYIREISNPFLKLSRVIDTIRIDSTGFFHTRIEKQHAGWIHLDMGVYKSLLFVKPGFHYRIDLPQKKDKNEAEVRNPYFNPLITHLQVLKETRISDQFSTPSDKDLNSRLYQFDTLIHNRNDLMLLTLNANLAYNSDSLIAAIEKMYANDSSIYFKKYRTLRYGLIKINSRDVGLEHIKTNYLSTAPTILDPAWMDLFNKMYDNFLFFYSQTAEGRAMNHAINRLRSNTELIKILGTHPAISNDTIAELVILKGINDSYHTNYFNKKALETILDSIISQAVAKENIQMAREIKNYLTRLKPGNIPPGFELPDQQGQIKTLEDFRGKYLYLIFCTPDNYGCLTEYPFLKALYNAHKSHLEVVTVIVTENYSTMQEFMKTNRYEWTSLYFENKERLLNDFDIRAYPTAFLIDKEGKLIQAPATLATEGLEQQLFRIMKARGDL